jgi:dienelactone hydrolase
MTRTIAVLLCVLESLLICFLSGCGGSSSPPPPVISVSVSVGGATSVPAGASTGLTAAITNDTTNQGVTWKATCSASQCGGVAPGSSLNGQAVNYSAPTAPPTSDLTVTVTATSVANPSATNSVIITVPAVTVAATPAAANVQAGFTVGISASVNNDIASHGVSWSISPATGAGTLTNPNPFVVTYTAPANPPASDATVKVTATSLFDPTKSFVVTITVPFATVSVTPATASTGAATSVSNISATVGNDPGNKGVNWSISCTTQPCGTLSSNTSGSGSPIMYTAPPNAPAADMPVTLTATSVADPTASASLTVTVLAITVTVAPGSSNVQFGDTVSNIVAKVDNDPAGKGVTWSVQPCPLAQCGSVSAQATPSGGAVSYTAPNSPVAGDTTINLVATSVSDTSKSGAASITIKAITISVTPVSGFIPVAATPALNATTFTATVNYDTSNQGVTWSLSQGNPPPTPCTNACGTLTPNATTASYAAPSAIPTNSSVNVTATSVTDTTKNATVVITLTNGTVKIIPANLVFGTLKITTINPHPSKTLSLDLTNTGGSDLGITGQTAPAPYSVTTPCPATVTSGSTCTIRLRFAPTTRGTFDTNFTIADNDVASPQQVPLSGRACTFMRCTAAAMQHLLVTDRPLTTPAPSGPNRVGTRTLNFVDPDRTDPYLTNGQKRELLVRFWYPTVFSRNCAPAPYASPAVWTYLSRLIRVPPPEVKTNSCQDAPITGGMHPVVVFTHGYTGTFTDYTFLFEDLASRGYVVASVAHTFESAAVEFPDGRLLTSEMGSHLAKNLHMDEPSTTLAVAVRLSDLKFVMNELERINRREKNPFFGALDLSHVALGGHSLGGLTALLGVEMEPRFRAAISLDGVAPSSWFGPTSKPVMLLVAGSDLWTENNCHVWTHLNGPRLAIDLKNSEHITPSDAIWLTDGAIQTSGGMDKTVAAIRDYVGAFLDTNLKAKSENQLLRGPSADYPDVEVVTQTQSQCRTTDTSLQH